MHDIVVQQGKIPLKDEQTQTPMIKSTRLDCFCGVSDSFSGSTGGLVFPLADLCNLYAPRLKSLIGGSVSDVCLRLDPPWLKCGFSLAATV